MLGIDIIKISRIQKMVQKFGQKGLERFLSKDEITLANGKIQTLAGFWAAKEAAAKALGCGIGKEVGFKDITIQKLPTGAPRLLFSDRVKEHFKIEEAALSISHDGDFAIAAVIIHRR